jgi:two-component sensor histidine kinase
MRSWRSWIPWRLTIPPTATKDQTAKETLPDIDGRSLRFRLLLWIVLALTPAAVVSIVQGIDRVQRDVADVRERLVQTAHASATDEESIFASAEQILRALANQPDVRGATDNCRKALTDALKGLDYFTNIARLSANGDVLCSAVTPAVGDRTVRGRAWWEDARTRKAFFVTPELYSTALNLNVMAGVLPLMDADRRFDGTVTVALDVRWLEILLHTKVPASAVAAVFDSAGHMVASNNPDAADKIFASRAKGEAVNDDTLFSGNSGGSSWSYTLVPLASNGTSVGYAMRDADLFSGTYLHVATDLLLPVLMLGAASAAIWIATERLVTRWIDYLRRVAGAYGRGHYAIRPMALEDAPNEFRSLGETFSGMAAGVQDRDRRLRDALAQKSLLIKEIHHRVKNNLQIVMSLLSLQANQMRDPTAQAALRQAQIRVNALALVHRILNEIEDLGAVDLKVLLEDLARQIQEGFGAERRDLKLELDIAARQIPGDLAVPLTLFTVEALTNAFKHAYPVGTHGGTIRLSLLPASDGRLRLAVEDDGKGIEQEQPSTGIGSRLIQAFATQVGGAVTVTRREAGGTAVALDFPDPLSARQPEDAANG